MAEMSIPDEPILLMDLLVLFIYRICFSSTNTQSCGDGTPLSFLLFSC